MTTHLSAATVTRLEKVAVDSGFDRDLPLVGAWLAFATTQTSLRVWLTATNNTLFQAALSQQHVAAGRGGTIDGCSTGAWPRRSVAGSSSR